LQDAPPRFFRGGRNTELPAVETVPEPSDCVLEINGNLPNGKPFQASCNVRSAAVDAVIGRGGGDITIDSQDVQRAHARIGGSVGMLTITDLGSSRGTWINRVPCLKGEIMFIGPDDLIFLGDVSFRIMVQPR
jgi:FHA domain